MNCVTINTIKLQYNKKKPAVIDNGRLFIHFSSIFLRYCPV